MTTLLSLQLTITAGNDAEIASLRLPDVERVLLEHPEATNTLGFNLTVLNNSTRNVNRYLQLLTQCSPEARAQILSAQPPSTHYFHFAHGLARDNLDCPPKENLYESFLLYLQLLEQCSPETIKQTFCAKDQSMTHLGHLIVENFIPKYAWVLLQRWLNIIIIHRSNWELIPQLLLAQTTPYKKTMTHLMSNNGLICNWMSLLSCHQIYLNPLLTLPDFHEHTICSKVYNLDKKQYAPIIYRILKNSLLPYEDLWIFAGKELDVIEYMHKLRDEEKNAASKLLTTRNSTIYLYFYNRPKSPHIAFSFWTALATAQTKINNAADAFIASVVNETNNKDLFKI